ncbi:MAG: PD-(D/E)XK nuclease family protein [Rhizobiaceae bacterium]|nr:PD-(D/E)XK nuclease family protein [Rhizobiaceae bacterium]
MTVIQVHSKVPDQIELEALLVNNPQFEKIGAYLNKFNPIKIMRMEAMEIRHSAVLAWLLDPRETHGLGDKFLRAFLSEALRGSENGHMLSALKIIESDLNDAEVRLEWQNIDIFIFCQRENWVFVIENKFYSGQHSDQLSRYMETVEKLYPSKKDKPTIQGIYLTLNDADANHPRYATIQYLSVFELLSHVVESTKFQMADEISVFIHHYLDVIAEAVGMSSEFTEMELIARDLYRKHRKTLDFIIEHGASTDFAFAARNITSENPDEKEIFQLGNSQIVFSSISKDTFSFLPKSWFDALGGTQHYWHGCENWWFGFPVIVYVTINQNNEGTEGLLRITAEVGPLADPQFRANLINAIEEVASKNKLSNIKFQKNASQAGKKYSRFLKNNSQKLTDVHEVEKIELGITTLVKNFEKEFESVAEVLTSFKEHGQDVPSETS